MRPGLLVAALAAPAVVLAQVPDRPGEILFSEGYGRSVRGAWIDLAECRQPAAFVNLTWYLRLPPGLSGFPPGGVYRVYASSAPVSGDTCRTASDPGGGFAGPVSAVLSGLDQIVYAGPVTVTIADVLAAAGVADCASVTDDAPVYVCAQGYAADGVTPAGIATGTMTLSVTAPSAPTSMGSDARDGALAVAWTAPAGDPPAYDYRLVAEADPADGRDPEVHAYPYVRATSTVLDRLVNGVQYRVQVYAQSEAGNPSAPAETLGTPSASASSDAWGLGCSSAPGGEPVALLAALAVLAVRRRRRAGFAR